ncbi:DUF2848 domain-containing protein [Photobacterium sp. GJ3]|uniref:DUF2848 domain-containing protein n=1 Tax=Photobacterium sp. GJ3 TaxID=2829502 RepID=UPI001B8AFA79|nr:DUF2848 domain-containing protein [Photobacterium sp. GJ3]QUJ66629.1 DUF2848 domain-containing protein [Photobacterium sp. GJ3]
MKFLVNGKYKEFQINKLIVAGWTGRDKSAVQAHIDELAEIGVAPPSTVPLFYEVADQMMTQTKEIQVLSKGTSGEVEPIIIRADNQYWFGIASDHTDRELEAFSVAHSKQVCPKPVSSELWPLSEIQDHLEQIQLTSWLDEGNGWSKYQQGTLKQIRPLEELIDKADLAENSAMLCGTFPAIGGVRRTAKFKMEAFDPVLQRSLTAYYVTVELAVVA